MKLSISQKGKPIETKVSAISSLIIIILFLSLQIIPTNELLMNTQQKIDGIKPLIRRSRSLITLLGSNVQASSSSVGGSGRSLELPDFQEPIGNHTVALGRDAQLSCKINNLANFRTAWLRVEDKGILTIHNNIITRNYRIGLINNDEGKDFILTIKNVQPSDKGGYMCQINSVPMKYNIGYLDVLTPPVFEDPSTSATALAQQTSSTESGQQQSAQSQMSAQQVQGSGGGVTTVSEGGNATLSCQASGHPQPTIVWRREDNEPILLNGLASSSEPSVTKLDSPSITLTNINRLNSGAYLCIASNGVQPSASKRQLLDVQFSPVIHLPQTEQAAHLNQAEARLRCYVELNPLGDYHWVKLSGPLATNDQSAGSTSTTTASSRRGEDLALASDDLALIESRDELMNSDKYEIVIKPATTITSQQQQSATVERLEMILNIKHITKQDFARYKCIARNALGIQSNSVRLYEESRPSTFSLNNMFRGGGGGGVNTESEHQPTPAGENSQPSDPLNPAHGGRANKQGGGAGGRTHTRSSWVQRGRSESGLVTPPTNALLDSPSGSSATRGFSQLIMLSKNHHENNLVSLLIVTLIPLFLANYSLMRPRITMFQADTRSFHH